MWRGYTTPTYHDECLEHRAVATRDTKRCLQPTGLSGPSWFQTQRRPHQDTTITFGIDPAIRPIVGFWGMVDLGWRNKHRPRTWRSSSPLPCGLFPQRGGETPRAGQIRHICQVPGAGVACRPATGLGTLTARSWGLLWEWHPEEGVMNCWPTEKL